MSIKRAAGNAVPKVALSLRERTAHFPKVALSLRERTAHFGPRFGCLPLAEREGYYFLPIA